MTSLGQDLMAGPPPTLLPSEPDVLAAIAVGASPEAIVRQFPASSMAWAALADQAAEQGQTIQVYAYARVGYHRGLDALRRNGWKGHGPVPWSHEPNRGFLRCLTRLGEASAAIGEQAEADRIAEFLYDCDPSLSQS
jgi:hypothetical protein